MSSMICNGQLFTLQTSPIQAGEVGVQLQIYPNTSPPPTNPINLLGTYLCELQILAPFGDVTMAVPLTVYPDGTYAYFFTTGAEFPQNGVYQLQLFAYFTNGATPLKSSLVQLSVGLSIV